MRGPRRLVRVAPGLGLFGLTAVLVFGPLGYFFATHPQDFTARLALMGVFQSGWFEREVAAGRPPAAIFFDQLNRAFLALNYYPDRSPHYAPGRPLLDFVPGVLFVSGAGFALSRVRLRGTFLALAWLGLAAVFGNALTVGPPYSARTVIMTPAVALLVSLGLVGTVRMVALVLGESLVWQRTAQLVLVLVVAYSGLSWYFQLYGEAKHHGDINTVVAMAVGQFIKAEGAAAFYFIGAPRMYHDSPTLAWVAYGVPGRDILNPLTSVREVPADDRRPLVFAGTPERAAEVQFIQAAYAGGDLVWLWDPNGRQHLAWAYVVRR